MQTIISETSFLLITQVINLWENEIELLLGKYGLTRAEFTVLASAYKLENEDKTATQTVVSSYACIRPMNASILLRKLQKQNLILRKEHPIDTRAKTVVLTTTGEELTIKLLAEIDKINTVFFQLSKNEEGNFIQKLQTLRDCNDN